jgi:hypothetical protein
LVLPWVSYKHFTRHYFKRHCEVFGGTLGTTKLYSMPTKNQKRGSIQSMFGFTMSSLQALHEALFQVSL